MTGTKKRNPLTGVEQKGHEELAELGRQHFAEIINCTNEDYSKIATELGLSACEFSRLRVMVQSSPATFKPKEEPKPERASAPKK